jgi:hypothetical protein
MVAGGIFLIIFITSMVITNLASLAERITFGIVGGLAAVAVFTLGKAIYSLAAKK